MTYIYFIVTLDIRYASNVLVQDVLKLVSLRIVTE